jgi:RNA polymerase sigma-70 factor (ECF subfamily)
LENKILYTHREIIEAAKAGDRSSQYRLYELYVDAMLNVAYRIVKRMEDAEDVVQEGFVKTFNKLYTFNYESTFGSWLKRIIINESISFLRKRNLDTSPMEDHDYHLTDEEVVHDQTYSIEKVKKGIKMLSTGYQQIINLYLVEGYDHVEISEIMGISQGTSKSQYHRAKKKLIDIINTI